MKLKFNQKDQVKYIPIKSEPSYVIPVGAIGEVIAAYNVYHIEMTVVDFGKSLGGCFCVPAQDLHLSATQIVTSQSSITTTIPSSQTLKANFAPGDKVVATKDLGLLGFIPKGTSGIITSVHVTMVGGTTFKVVNTVQFITKNGSHPRIDVDNSDITLDTSNFILPPPTFTGGNGHSQQYPYPFYGSPVDSGEFEFVDSGLKIETKCECGAHSTGSNKHSSWCGMYSKSN